MTLFFELFWVDTLFLEVVLEDLHFWGIWMNSLFLVHFVFMLYLDSSLLDLLVGVEEVLVQVILAHLLVIELSFNQNFLLSFQLLKLL